MKTKLANFTLRLFEALEITFVALAFLALMFYPMLSSKVEISYGNSGEKIQITGSDLALRTLKGLHETAESSFIKRTYEFQTVEDKPLSEMDGGMTEVFATEVAEVASSADKTKVTVTVDENGYLLAYDPNGYLDIQNDLPVFTVPVGDESGYVFGFTPVDASVDN